jgi:hypothetical protein
VQNTKLAYDIGSRLAIYSFMAKIAGADFGSDSSSVQESEDLNFRSNQNQESRDFVSRSGLDRRTPATNQSSQTRNFAKQPPEMVPDQTFETNTHKTDFVGARY